MKILVCITHVPDTTSRIAFTDNNTSFDISDIQFIIGPYDDYALSRAVDFKSSHKAGVTALNVGTIETEPTLRRALAIGADEAIRINARPADATFVAFQIAHVIRENDFDLVLMGRESIDYNGGIVHTLTGGLTGIPAVSPVMSLEVEKKTFRLSREIEGGREYMEGSLPLIAGCQEPVAEWKIPNMRGIMTARNKPFHILEPVGAPQLTETILFELPPPRDKVKLVDAHQVEELVALLKNEAKVI